MVFKVSSGRVSGGIRQAAPANYGRATKYNSVQQILDNTVGRANEQYLEAIAVDGIEFQYWHRCTEGRFCTCQNPSATSMASLKQPDAKQDVAANNQQADANTLPDSAGDDPVFRVRGGPSRREVINKVDIDTALGVTIGDNNDGSTTRVYNENTSDNEDLAKSADQDAFLRQGQDSGILFGGEKTQCGICFGTGFVNGYSLFNGKREIFDASGTYPYTLSKFSLNRKTFPFAFTAPLDKTAYVEWLYELPTYFIQCCSLVARDNTKDIGEYQLTYQIDGTQDAFAPLTIDFINGRIGIPTVLNIRISPIASSIDSGTFEFTHLEMTLQYSAWPKMQMAALGQSTNFSVFNTLLTTSMILPPNLPIASKEDVIYEFKYNDIWKVTTVIDQQTAKLQVMGWNADVRIVQDYEQLALLRLSATQNFSLDYSSLNTAQGLALASADQLIDPADAPAPTRYQGI